MGNSSGHVGVKVCCECGGGQGKRSEVKDEEDDEIEQDL